MITNRVRTQLIIFLVITLLATTYVGAKYARLDRLFGSDGYSVVVEMADSGGIFTGADVTYRGVSVGRVADMWLTTDGVDVEVRVEDGAPSIPVDTDVVVANKSAVGEQFLDFQPAGDAAPFLEDGSTLPRERTQVPIDTQTLLTDVNALLESVDADDLSVVIGELGDAFEGSATDIRQIIDSTNSFITTADEKYEVTADLIRSSNQVLKTQVGAQSNIRDFSKDLRDLTTAMVASDADLRAVLDTGPATAATLRAVLAENSADVADLMRAAVTLNKVVVGHLDGVQGVLAIAPYGVESAFSLIATDSRTGQSSIRLSLSMQSENEPCFDGFKPDPRSAFDRTPAAWDRTFTCSKATPRGTGKASPGASGSKVAPASVGAESQTLGTYDVATNTIAVDDTSVIPAGVDLGKESWKWMVMGPAAAR